MTYALKDEDQGFDGILLSDGGEVRLIAEKLKEILNNFLQVITTDSLATAVNSQSP